ncbi:MAG: metal-dependent hydrolase [Thermodesulfobacteriota bacterium]|nr:metal-dependent hydrolase [Thermodesulfobacteriota bacterium]
MRKVKFFACVWFVCIFLLLISMPLRAAEIGKEVKVTYLGHAAFKLVSPKGVVIYVDPFLSGNPKTPPEMKTVEKADLILVTHGHGDHVGDTLAIAEKTNAKVIAMPELGRYLTRKGAKNVVGMNKGGTVNSHGIAITMVHALHSSSVTEGDQVIYTGDPVGFVIRFENGFTLYHAGDTGVFGDMKIIGEIYKPEVSFLPIGGLFTMGPREAAYAAKLLGSKVVVPMHYGTFPVLTGTVEDFQKWMKESPQTKVLIVKPGETIQ